MGAVLYGVGVGPGDAELMTLKAVRIIKSCDIVGIPAKDAASCAAYRVALEAVPEMADKPVLAVPVPMTADRQRLSEVYDEGCRRLEKELAQGKKIAFLNLGDPTIYGTYMELHSRVLKAGYEARVISGVPSFCAVAAALDVPLGARKENIHILPGFYHAEELAQYDGTRILMKSGGKVGEVKKKLIELEERGNGKALAITNCGMENQAVYRDIRLLDEEAGYFTTIIVKEEWR